MDNVKCKGCGTELKEDIEPILGTRIPCAQCGSISRIFDEKIELRTSSGLYESIRAKHSGKSKYYVDEIHGPIHQHRTGRTAILRRTIDRENDLYCELVIDPATNSIIHECKEKLSEHMGHGSAKFRK